MAQGRFLRLDRLPLARYVAAVALVALSIVITSASWRWTQPAVALVFLAVMVAAWWGGFWPGVLASILAAFCVEYFLMEPRYQIEIEARHLLRLTVFVASAVLISFLNASRRNAQHALIQANNALEQRVHDRTAELLAQQARMRDLTSELALSEERQRREIATALHDGLGQLLVLAEMKLQQLQYLPAPAGSSTAVNATGTVNVPQIAKEVGDLLEEAVTHTRALTFQLSPPILYELGLDAALQWLAEQAEKRSGIGCRYEPVERAEPLDEERRIVLFQAARELMNNVVKHSKAAHARMTIRRHNGEIILGIEDNGVGFDSNIGRVLKTGGGFGLLNVRERLKHYDGRFQIESEPGEGTRFTVALPIER